MTVGNDVMRRSLSDVETYKQTNKVPFKFKNHRIFKQFQNCDFKIQRDFLCHWISENLCGKISIKRFGSRSEEVDSTIDIPPFLVTSRPV